MKSPKYKRYFGEKRENKLVFTKLFFSDWKTEKIPVITYINVTTIVLAIL